jgi:hypothetical protein
LPEVEFSRYKLAEEAEERRLAGLAGNLLDALVPTANGEADQEQHSNSTDDAANAVVANQGASLSGEGQGSALHVNNGEAAAENQAVEHDVNDSQAQDGQNNISPSSKLPTIFGRTLHKVCLYCCVCFLMLTLSFIENEVLVLQPLW